MKRNSILLLILAGLLTFTYFFEELSTRKKVAQNEKKSELFSQSEYGEVRTINLADAEISFQGEELLIGPERIRGDFTKVKKLLDLLGALKVESILSNDEVAKMGEKNYLGESPIKMNFTFEKGVVNFWLGRKLDISQSFYVKVESPEGIKFAIVKDTTPREGVYWRKDDANHDYLRLSEWLQRSNSFFYNLSVLRGELSLTQVSVSNLRNRPFKLNYESGKTEPLPPQGVEISTTALGAFERMLSQMKGHKVIPLHDPKELEELLATMNLETKQKEHAVWEIYRRHKGEIGPFLYMQGDRLIYQLGSNELRAFFSNVQEFWDLRPLAVEPSDYVVTLKIKGKEAKTHFPNILKPYFFAQAERMSVRSADDDIWAQKFKELLQLDFKGSLFSAKLFERELMIENQATGIRYYYRVGEEIPFPLDLKSYESKAP